MVADVKGSNRKMTLTVIQVPDAKNMRRMKKMVSTPNPNMTSKAQRKNKVSIRNLLFGPPSSQ